MILKSSKLLKKGDIIIILSVAAFSLIWFLTGFFSLGEKQQVKIYLDGEIYEVVDLDGLEKEKIISLEGCEIAVSKEGARFLQSDCPDGLCVKRGMLKRSGEVMACVPKGITLEIVGGASVDGISY